MINKFDAFNEINNKVQINFYFHHLIGISPPSLTFLFGVPVFKAYKLKLDPDFNDMCADYILMSWLNTDISGGTPN